MATARACASPRRDHGRLRRPRVSRRERGEGCVDGRGDRRRPRVGKAIPSSPRARERGDRAAARRSVSLAVLWVCPLRPRDRRDRAVVARPRRAPLPVLHARPRSRRRGAGRGPGGVRPDHRPAQSGARPLRGTSQPHRGAVCRDDDDCGPGGRPCLGGPSRSWPGLRLGGQPSGVADRVGGSGLRGRALLVVAVAVWTGRCPARRPLFGSAHRGHERAPRGGMGANSGRRRGLLRRRVLATPPAGPRFRRVDPAR